MRNIFISLFFLVAICGNALSADVWQVTATDVTNPSLLTTRISFTLTLNGSEYVSSYVEISSDELMAATTTALKRSLIMGKINNVVAPYKTTYNVTQGLKAMIVGQQATL